MANVKQMSNKIRNKDFVFAFVKKHKLQKIQIYPKYYPSKCSIFA